jgi:phosphomannomutase / phosphoglucomutase
MFCDMDGRFPNHHPDPTVEENLEALPRARARNRRRRSASPSTATRSHRRDRRSRRVVWGDKLMILFAARCSPHPGAAIIGEVKCSQTLYDDIAALGGNPIMWKTGHSLIKKP